MKKKKKTGDEANKTVITTDVDGKYTQDIHTYYFPNFFVCLQFFPCPPK